MKNEQKAIKDHMASLEQANTTLDTKLGDVLNKLKKNNLKTIENVLKSHIEEYKIDMKNINKRVSILEESKS